MGYRVFIIVYVFVWRLMLLGFICVVFIYYREINWYVKKIWIFRWMEVENVFSCDVVF